MTYIEFINKITKSGIEINPNGGRTDDFFHFPEGNKYNSQMKPKFDFILQSWRTGGVDGGSCWDSSDPQEYTIGDEHRPKSFSDLDKILTKFSPKITFLQYKVIENDLVHSGSNIEYEYYGNRTDYSYQYVKLLDLFDYLTTNDLIQ